MKWENYEIHSKTSEKQNKKQQNIKQKLEINVSRASGESIVKRYQVRVSFGI